MLIIGSDYMANTSANGICTNNIANELIKRGYDIYVLSEAYKNEILLKADHITVYGVKSTFFTKVLGKMKGSTGWRAFLLIVIRIVRGCITGVLFPNTSPLRSRNIYKKAQEICEEYKIQFVISTYRPYEAVFAAVKLARKNYNMFVCSYHLDLLSSPNTSNRILKKYKVWRAEKAFKKEQKNLNLILLPKSAYDLVNDKKKTVFVDFPLYVPQTNNLFYDYKFDSSYINIVYIGSIDGKNRELEYLAKLLDHCNGLKTLDRIIRVHIWGSVTDYHTNRIIESNKYIVYNGILENKYSNGIYEKGDFCLNLSNKITYQMVPSKIFQLFSVKKPILNIVENPNDYSLKYFSRSNYTLSLMAYNADYENDSIKVMQFIKQCAGEKVIVDDDLFYESTPEYIVNTILAENSRMGN